MQEFCRNEFITGIDNMGKDQEIMTEKNAEAVVRIYGDMLYRLCLVMPRSESSAEDAVQETVIKYLYKAPAFNDSEHEKAWLIRTAQNQCRDMLRARSRHPRLDIDELSECLPSPEVMENSGILDALAALPEKFRIVLTLYYIEELSTEEIARIIGRSASAVKMRLQKGRRLLEEKYRKEYM